MGALRSRLTATLRSAIETHLRLVDTLAEGADDDPVIAGKVAYLDASTRAERTDPIDAAADWAASGEA